jgi:hypothetical protein
VSFAIRLTWSGHASSSKSWRLAKVEHARLERGGAGEFADSFKLDDEARERWRCPWWEKAGQTDKAGRAAGERPVIQRVDGKPSCRRPPH